MVTKRCFGSSSVPPCFSITVLYRVPLTVFISALHATAHALHPTHFARFILKPNLESKSDVSRSTVCGFERNHSLPKLKSMTTDFSLSPLITLTLPSVLCPLGDATLTVSPVSRPRLDASDELRYMNPSGWGSSSHSLLVSLD